MRQWILCLTAPLAFMGCATGNHLAGTLHVSYLPSTIEVDGHLDEEVYAQRDPLTSFVVAGDRTVRPPRTEAWLFWNEEGLVCAFRCADATPACTPPDSNERSVDGQDRAELFLWPGHSGRYFCVEAAPAGAIHDYEARFYRNFDDDWSPTPPWQCWATQTSAGYTVEMSLSRQALEQMKINLEPNAGFKVGLFRADFDKLNGQPVWVTWTDHGRKPDFHTADSFGKAVLSARR